MVRSSEAVRSLVESPQLYKMVTGRLDLLDVPELNFESELMELIFDLYSREDAELSVEKLQRFSMSQVMVYLQASHKLYISKTMPEIEQSMVHIQRRFDNTPEILNALVVFFNDYKTRFLEHIRMEERDFFPFLKKLDMAQSGKMELAEVVGLLNQCSIDSFVDDHDAIEDQLKSVSNIIHTYAGGDEVPLPFKVFLNQVEVFEMDLRKHAIIEDYVLVPMARRIEKDLRNKFFA